MQANIRKILVPLDFSHSSEYALSYAKALASAFRASLHVLHVIEDRLMTGPWPVEVYLGELPRLREGLIKDAEGRLLECLESLAKGGLRATGEVLIGGPSQTIVEAAVSSGADLIVMGTHGRTGIAHMLIGSVAERVIRHASCPVLVVRELKAAEGTAVPVPVPAAS